MGGQNAGGSHTLVRLWAFVAVIALSYGWAALPKRWLAKETVQMSIRCGALLMAMMLAGPALLGAVSWTVAGHAVLLFGAFPLLLAHVAGNEGRLR